MNKIKINKIIVVEDRISIDPCVSWSLCQVLEVLEAMHLGRYKDVFSEKQIDGMVFAELNEALLEHELGVKSKLHRLRLLMVSKGKQKVNCKGTQINRLAAKE